MAAGALTGSKRPNGLPIVNVAMVPQRSPFRYPGGKTWLNPCIRTWLKSPIPRAEKLIEPFAGAAIPGPTAVFEGLVQFATLLDDDIVPNTLQPAGLMPLAASLANGRAQRFFRASHA